VLALAFVSPPAPAERPVAGLIDPTQLLDVDVNQLAWAGALVAPCRFEANPPESAQTDAEEDARDGRLRHSQRLGDLRSGHPQSPQGADRADALLGGAVVHATSSRGAIEQSGVTFVAVATRPLTGRRPPR
jgi:hypothetical protein